MEAHDVREELDLFRLEVTMSSIDLIEDLAGIDEQHRISSIGCTLALVEKPKSARQRDGVEEVGPDRDDHVD